MSDIADIARRLWADARPLIVQQAAEALAAAQEWDATGDPAARTALGQRSHQLAGSLGSYAAAMRDRTNDGQPGHPREQTDAEVAAAAALALDATLQEQVPDTAAVVRAAEELVEALAST